MSLRVYIVPWAVLFVGIRFVAAKAIPTSNAREREMIMESFSFIEYIICFFIKKCKEVNGGGNCG